MGRVRAVLMMAVLVHRLLAPADLRLADSSQIKLANSTCFSIRELYRMKHQRTDARTTVLIA